MAPVAEYDVCLSFAGEDRPYVDRVASKLRDLGVRVFYDGYEEAELWGKNLYQHLADVYRKRARFCVIFASAAYARKLWTKHELEQAQARALEESREYILPARFDDTEIPGVLPTTGYVDLRSKTPEDLATLIHKKVEAFPSTSAAATAPGLSTPMPRRAPAQPSTSLNQQLNEAVSLAHDYLLPHALSTAEAVAEVIRRSIQRSAARLKLDDVTPFLRSGNAAYRVVGYLAAQALVKISDNTPDWIIELTAGLARERREASERNETRPLWQLLVALDLAASSGIPRYERDFARNALNDMLAFLRANSHMDPGGECKHRLQQVLGRLS
jgi:TIR domain-containing protein